MPVRFLGFLMCLSVLFAVAIMAGTAQAEATYDDFSTDPYLATEWSQYIYYGASADAAWDATDEDLDLYAGYGDKMACLYRTTPAATRSATDPVTLTIMEYSASKEHLSDWANVGLMIARDAEPALCEDTSPRYAFEVVTADGGTSWHYRVRSGGYPDCDIYMGAAGDVGDTPIKLDIVRDGDDYRFKANGTVLFSDDAVDRWGQADADALAYYEIIWGSGSSTVLHATVDDFGVQPFWMPGDASKDGTVDSTDAAILAANWLGTGKRWSEGDFNSDRTVDDIDATIMATNWGWTSPGNATVPEPQAILLLLTGLCSLLVLRRR